MSLLVWELLHLLLLERLEEGGQGLLIETSPPMTQTPDELWMDNGG